MAASVMSQSSFAVRRASGLLLLFVVPCCSTDEGSSPKGDADAPMDADASTGGSAASAAGGATGSGGSVGGSGGKGGGAEDAGRDDGKAVADAMTDPGTADRFLGSCTFSSCPEGGVGVGDFCALRVLSAVPPGCTDPAGSVRFRWCECGDDGCADGGDLALGQWMTTEPVSCEGRDEGGCICAGEPGPCKPGEFRDGCRGGLFQQCSCDGTEWRSCDLQFPIDCNAGTN